MIAYHGELGRCIQDNYGLLTTKRSKIFELARNDQGEIDVGEVPMEWRRDFLPSEMMRLRTWDPSPDLVYLAPALEEIDVPNIVKSVSSQIDRQSTDQVPVAYIAQVVQQGLRNMFLNRI